METASPPPILNPPAEVDAAIVLPVAPRSAGRQARIREVVRGLLRSKTFMFGAVVLFFWVFDAIFWQLYVPHDPQAIDPVNILTGPSGAGGGSPVPGPGAT